MSHNLVSNPFDAVVSPYIEDDKTATIASCANPDRTERKKPATHATACRAIRVIVWERSNVRDLDGIFKVNAGRLVRQSPEGEISLKPGRSRPTRHFFATGSGGFNVSGPS
jgi:hypothetical protein